MAQTLQKISDLIQTRQLVEAADALRKLVKKKSRTPQDWRTAFRLAATLGDFDAALLAAQHAVEFQPNDPHAQLMLIEALGQVSQHEAAAKKARALQSHPAAAADAYFLEGVHLARLGDRDAAAGMFREALSIRRDHASAWEQLALIDAADPGAGDVDEMQSLLSRSQTAQLKIPLLYALGRTFDRIGDYDQAYACFVKGGQLRQQVEPVDVQPLLAYLQRLQQSFSPSLIEDIGAESGGANLVFIVAPPRSGSTLIEQILATAPSTTPTGEHTLLRLATLELGSMEPADITRARSMKPAAMRKMAQQFETALRKRYGAGKTYTDKTILNLYYVGLIRILFPNARIIQLHRNAPDVAWSCFTSRIQGNEWAQSLAGCAAYLNAHARLCGHWAEICRGEMIDVRYEDLVSAPDAETSRLFERLAIDRPADWSEFYLNKNAVATASLAQVRRPLSAGSINRWRRYEKHLGGEYESLFHEQ